MTSADPYPRRLSVGDLELIAESPRHGGEDAVEVYYTWRETRCASYAKGAAGAALSIFTAWFFPFLKNEYDDAPAVLVWSVPLVVLAALTISALAAFRRLNVIHTSFARAVALLQVFR